MSSIRLTSLLLGLGLAAVAFFFFVLVPKGSSTEAPELPAEQGSRAPLPEAALKPTERPEGRREPALESERTRDGGMVRSTDGRPIEGTRVILLALKEEDAQPLGAWDGPGVPERKAVETTTGADGRFRFLQPPGQLPFGAVLLAFHPGHLAGGLDLPVDLDSWPAELAVALEPAAPISVEVLDALGKSQAAAIVYHVGKPRRPTEDAPLRIHERFFAQQALTNLDGRVEIASLPGEQALWAEKGTLISVPWQGMRPFAVTLTLGESFTIGGTVACSNPGEWDPRESGGRRILVSGFTGNLWRPVVCVDAAQEGAWGPVRVPLAGVARYRARIEGAPVIPVEESFDRPEASSHRRIDFVVQRGAEVFLLVQDESSNPVPTAWAEAWWEPTMYPTVRITAAAGADGVIRLATLPTGWFRFRLAAPGYTTQDLEAEAVDRVRIPVTLQRGGRITGRCVHEGIPVADFQVIYWKTGSIYFHLNESFFGRRDGHFEIDGLAPGDWSIHAASPAFPCGRPLTVSVNAERDTEVELELPTAIRGGGRVLAEDTGEPVPNALVQPFSSGGLGRSLPWGSGVPSASDGSFDLDAFVLGVNHLTIEADGFALAEAEATATDTEFLDWSDIRLFRPQNLQISLLGFDLQGVDPTSYSAGTEQGHILPKTSFDQKGIVRYEGVPPGDHRLMVYCPDGSWKRLQLRLDPGKEWNFDLKVAGDRKLDVHVVDEQGQVPSSVTGVYWTAQEDTGVFVVRFARTEEGHVSFQGIRAAQGQIWVLADDDSILATKDVALGADTSKSVEVRLGEESFRVHVVDPHRDPIPGVWVTIRSATGAEIHGADDTGADGWAELGGRPSGPLLMDVQHAVLGRCFGVPIDASVKELEFVLEASGSLELELVDGDLPLAGVLTRIETTAGLTLGDARQTDDQGRVRYEALGAGNYHLACHRTDCWPTTVDEELASGETARVRVQMRRLGDLEFTLFSSDGLPVSGVEVEFRSEEFDAPLDAWLSEERIRAPGGLTTDLRGSIRVEGLPRGPFTWSATAFDQPITGSIDLTAARENKVSAFLPR